MCVCVCVCVFYLSIVVLNLFKSSSTPKTTATATASSSTSTSNGCSSSGDVREGEGEMKTVDSERGSGHVGEEKGRGEAAEKTEMKPPLNGGLIMAKHPLAKCVFFLMSSIHIHYLYIILIST